MLLLHIATNFDPNIFSIGLLAPNNIKHTNYRYTLRILFWTHLFSTLSIYVQWVPLFSGRKLKTKLRKNQPIFRIDIGLDIPSSVASYSRRILNSSAPLIGPRSFGEFRPKGKLPRNGSDIYCIPRASIDLESLPLWKPFSTDANSEPISSRMHIAKKTLPIQMLRLLLSPPLPFYVFFFILHKIKEGKDSNKARRSHL